MADAGAKDAPKDGKDKAAAGQDEQLDDFVADFEDEIEECKPGECCPPSTGKMVIMGAGALVVFVVLFFLMVRLVERVFIRRQASPLLGRHLGISVALFLGTAAMAAIFFVVTGCWYFPFTYWLVFAAVVWAIHMLYTLFAVRRD